MVKSVVSWRINSGFRIDVSSAITDKYRSEAMEHLGKCLPCPECGGGCENLTLVVIVDVFRKPRVVGEWVECRACVPEDTSTLSELEFAALPIGQLGLSVEEAIDGWNRFVKHQMHGEENSDVSNITNGT